MALYDGLNIKTNIAANAWNQLFKNSYIDWARNETPFLYAITGKNQSPLKPGGNFGFKNVNRIDGQRIELRVMAEYETPVYITTGADGLTGLTASSYYNDNAYGAMEFETARVVLPIWIPGKELDKIKGSSAKYGSFIEDQYKRIRSSWMNFLSTEMHSTNAPVEATIGGWQYIVSDATNTGNVDESTYATYGLLNRADSTNAAARGTVYRGVGDLTPEDLRLATSTIQTKGGNPDFGVCNTAAHMKIRQIVEAFTHTTYDQSWARFGSKFVSFDGVAYILDGYCASGTVGIFDSSTWSFWMKDGDIIEDGLTRDRSVKDGFSMPTFFAGQFLCDNPRWNAKLLGITG